MQAHHARSVAGMSVTIFTILLSSWVAQSAPPAIAAEYDWMQTARVFLIDDYEPPFDARLEYDAKALAETMVRMNANAVRISVIGKLRRYPASASAPTRSWAIAISWRRPSLPASRTASA